MSASDPSDLLHDFLGTGVSERILEDIAIHSSEPDECSRSRVLGRLGYQQVAGGRNFTRFQEMADAGILDKIKMGHMSAIFVLNDLILEPYIDYTRERIATLQAVLLGLCEQRVELSDSDIPANIVNTTPPNYLL